MSRRCFDDLRPLVEVVRQAAKDEKAAWADVAQTESHESWAKWRDACNATNDAKDKVRMILVALTGTDWDS